MSDIDPVLLAAIRQVIREEVTKELKEIKESLATLVDINKRLEEVEKGLQFTSERLDSAIKTILPSLSAHMTQLSEGLAMQTLQIDVHRRKWNLIVHGIEGPANEDEKLTRAACIKFAKDILQVEDAESTRLAACHRLSRKADAGIIIRFCDLAQRDLWLAGSSNLKGLTQKISISPDLPPVLRPMKDSLMLTRKNLPPTVKSESRVRYLHSWPFVELQIKNAPTQRPATSKSDIVKNMLKFDPFFEIVENVEPVNPEADTS